MLNSYLMENFGYNEPIFINDLSVEGLSENAVRQSVKRLVANGFLERYDNGIYYIPKRGGLLGKSYLDPFLVIMRKYVQNKSETYGYVTGISFANQIGLTTQMPAVIEVVTNREATNGRMVKIGKLTVRIKKSTLTVSDSNAELLQLLERENCRILKRSLLQCEIGDKVFYALNEIALQRDLHLTSSQILGLELQSREGRNTLSGDGILICTPTGSTAYSLSAGGAILTPEVPVLMMTPICAFSMRARPIVFSNDETFIVRIKRGQAVVLADGLPIAGLPENAEIRIKKAPFTADFPVRENSDFFAKVRNKLNE